MYSVYYAIDADASGRTLFDLYNREPRGIVFVRQTNSPLPTPRERTSFTVGSQVKNTPQALEEIFTRWNGMSARPEFNRRGSRSMSVGDIVVFHETLEIYICAPFGWVRIPNDQPAQNGILAGVKRMLLGETEAAFHFTIVDGWIRGDEYIPADPDAAEANLRKAVETVNSL